MFGREELRIMVVFALSDVDRDVLAGIRSIRKVRIRLAQACRNLSYRKAPCTTQAMESGCSISVEQENVQVLVQT